MKLKNNFSLFIVFIFGIFVIRDFLLPGFIPTHDGEYHLIRLWQFDKMIKSGSFFPRWAPDLNNGYGIPLFQFFYPFPNYIGEFFHLLGFSLVNSIKLVLASGLIISGLTFYLWMRCFFGSWSAAVGAIFYILAPYHLVDIFIRGSVGEVWALAIAPLVLFLITRLIKGEKKERKKFLILNSISLLCLLTSHNILGLLFYAFAFIYGIILAKRSFMWLFFSFFLGFFLAGFFWIPAILESQYITGLEIVNYQDHFPAFFQLVIPSWGSGFSVPGVSDQLSFQIGLAHILVFVIAFFWLLLRDNKNTLLFFLVATFLVSLFLMLEDSILIWKLFPFMTYFQYPWRLLSLVVLITSFLAGYVASKNSKITVPIFIFLPIFCYFSYTKPVVYKPRSDRFYLDNPTWTTGTATLGNTFNTVWFHDAKKTVEEKIEIMGNKGDIKNLKIESTRYSFTVQASSRINLRVNTAYFPGWTVLIDNQKEQINYDDGLINFPVSPGEHSIIVKFGDTIIRRAAKTISLISGLVILPL